MSQVLIALDTSSAPMFTGASTLLFWRKLQRPRGLKAQRSKGLKVIRAVTTGSGFRQKSQSSNLRRIAGSTNQPIAGSTNRRINESWDQRFVGSRESVRSLHFRNSGEFHYWLLEKRGSRMPVFVPEFYGKIARHLPVAVGNTSHRQAIFVSHTPLTHPLFPFL